jgi:hypothetical protein
MVVMVVGWCAVVVVEVVTVTGQWLGGATAW